MGKYPTITSIYERYRKADLTIVFEGRQYKFKRSIRLNDVTKHIYRNEEEQHTLFVHMHNGKPFYVDAFYAIEGALWYMTNEEIW